MAACDACESFDAGSDDVCFGCEETSDWLSFVCLLFCETFPKTIGEEGLAKASETGDFFLAALISFLSLQPLLPFCQWGH
jgi:hypothetical protein